MSQFSPPDAYTEPTYGEPPIERKTSMLAVSSLVCSLIFCCPLTTLLGILLGVIGFFKVGGNPALKGRGLAIAGIVIGVLGTLIQVVGGMAVNEKFIKPVMAGPHAALVAGFGGDVAGFKAGFTGAGASASDAEAAAYIESLRGRFGDFQSCAFDESSPPQTKPGQPAQTFPYVLTFSNATVDAEAEMVFADQVTGQFIMKFSYLTVFTDDGEEITFPASP